MSSHKQEIGDRKTDGCEDGRADARVNGNHNT